MYMNLLDIRILKMPFILDTGVRDLSIIYLMGLGTSTILEKLHNFSQELDLFVPYM